MNLNFESINWLAVGVCVVVGQIFLTLWFTALFGNPWAKTYGVEDKKQHTAEVPGYTYAIGLICTALLTIAIATIQATAGINTFGHGIQFGLFIAFFICIPTALPGYAFLKRWNAFILAAGSQASVTVIISSVLSVWK